MPHCRLRVFRGPENEDLTTRRSSNDVTVPVGDLLPLLADAVASERTWLSDFEEDEMTISSDLYEVLQAYRFFRRPSA